MSATTTQIDPDTTSRTTTVLGIDTHYHDAGDGPPVLMLHDSGPGASAWSNWRPVYPGLSRDFRLPYSFLKPPTTTVVGEGAAVAFPPHAEKLDYEAELAVVMGADGEVFGYTPMNDLSVRDWVPGPTLLGKDWVMLKAFDGSAPLGPTNTPARFVTDVQDLTVRSWVNGELRQDSSTSDMTFTVAELVTHLGSLMTLEPGDVIVTGTPAGVSAGLKPLRFLAPGDEVAIEVEGLGRLTTHIATRVQPTGRRQ